jgi:hypothetical protein
VLGQHEMPCPAGSASEAPLVRKGSLVSILALVFFLVACGSDANDVATDESSDSRELDGQKADSQARTGDCTAALSDRTDEAPDVFVGRAIMLCRNMRDFSVALRGVSAFRDSHPSEILHRVCTDPPTGYGSIAEAPLCTEALTASVISDCVERERATWDASQDALQEARPANALQNIGVLVSPGGRRRPMQDVFRELTAFHFRGNLVPTEERIDSTVALPGSSSNLAVRYQLGDNDLLYETYVDWLRASSARGSPIDTDNELAERFQHSCQSSEGVEEPVLQGE